MITRNIKFMNSFNKRLDTGECGVTCWTELLLKERKPVFFPSISSKFRIRSKEKKLTLILFFAYTWLILL